MIHFPLFPFFFLVEKIFISITVISIINVIIFVNIFKMLCLIIIGLRENY